MVVLTQDKIEIGLSVIGHESHDAVTLHQCLDRHPSPTSRSAVLESHVSDHSPKISSMRPENHWKAAWIAYRPIQKDTFHPTWFDHELFQDANHGCYPDASTHQDDNGIVRKPL
jgi:hypothetical protein